MRRTAAIAPTLEEKLSWQKRQRELETRRGKLRRALFARQDEIEAQRNDLIDQLEAQLEQRVDELSLFTVEWKLVRKRTKSWPLRTSRPKTIPSVN